ncbi:hypothetical protein [Holospora elegans]|uniref:hypothetical protein n=1 Tax=Holospora elegans TaxID=431043 RepID=UPI00139F2BD4|nr:hypothetical protein [Holospora elegans]
MEEIKKYFSEKDNVNKYVEEFVKGLKGADPSDRIQISKMIRQASSSMKNEDIQSELFNLIQRIILDKVLQDAKQVPLPSKIKIISNGPNQSQKDLNTQTKSTSKDEASINKTQANGPENEDSIHKTQEGISEDDVSVHSAQASDSGSNFSEDYTDKNMRSTYFKQNKEPTSENEANNS